ncbi:hypothetical protein PG994_008698, partial [Apiospora phragmitis]
MESIVRPFRWFYHEFGIISIHDSGRNAWIIILARLAACSRMVLYHSFWVRTPHNAALSSEGSGVRKSTHPFGIIFATFENFWILLFAAVVGVVSVTGGDFGPFRSIEEKSTYTILQIYVVAANYTLHEVGCSQLGEQQGANRGTAAISSLPSSAPLSPQVPQNWFRRSTTWLSDRLCQISVPTRRVMYKLWILLALDSVADGMVPYSWTTYYMDENFHPSKSTLGDVISVAYFLGAISAMFAGPLARRIALLFVRSALNPLDQAPRTVLIAAVVRPEERTAVMGITSLVRTCAAMIGPTLTGLLAANKQFWLAFFVAGIARLSYDFGLYAMFINIKLHQHETQPISTLDGQVDEEQPLELERVSFSTTDSEDLEVKTKKEGGGRWRERLTSVARREREGEEQKPAQIFCIGHLSSREIPEKTALIK